MHVARIQTIVMWVLLGIIALLIGYQYFANKTQVATFIPIDAALQQQILAWEQAQSENVDVRVTNANHHEPDHHQPATALPLSTFDPNTDNLESLIEKGVPKGVAKNIVNYRNAGGKYYKAEQLKKLYAMNDSIYRALLPFIHIDQSQREKNDDNKEFDRSQTPTVAKVSTKKININTATAADFESQKGIGPAFANRIIKFRDILGGFYAVDQLKEVYGFPDSTYQALKNEWIVNPEEVKKIDINAATYNDLARHPYIGKQLASEILKFIKQNGHFKEKDNLTQVPLLNEEKYRKIAPYIKVVHN